MTTTIERVTERDYIRHEIEALFAAQDRGDKADVRLTSATLQQILHIIGLGAGDVGETCSRIYMENGSYRLPNRERESQTGIGSSLKALRSKAGMSLEEVSEVAGISAVYLAHAEDNLVKPAACWVQLVAVAISEHLAARAHGCTPVASGAERSLSGTAITAPIGATA